MKLSPNGFSFIKKETGFSARAFLASPGIPAIGYGTTIKLDLKRVSLADRPITKELASELLSRDLMRIELFLNNHMNQNVNQNQFDALVSLCYSLGVERFRSTSILTYINECNFEAVSNLIYTLIRNEKEIDRREREKNLFDRPMA
jgi:GH24 family phage-related lysozyme (muramidase)